MMCIVYKLLFTVLMSFMFAAVLSYKGKFLHDLKLHDYHCNLTFS